MMIVAMNTPLHACGNGGFHQVTKLLRELFESRKSPLAKKVPVIPYYQPDFKRGEFSYTFWWHYCRTKAPSISVRVQ